MKGGEDGENRMIYSGEEVNVEHEVVKGLVYDFKVSECSPLAINGTKKCLNGIRAGISALIIC